MDNGDIFIICALIVAVIETVIILGVKGYLFPKLFSKIGNRKGNGGSFSHTRNTIGKSNQSLPSMPQQSPDSPSGFGFSFDILPFRKP